MSLGQRISFDTYAAQHTQHTFSNQQSNSDNALSINSTYINNNMSQAQMNMNQLGRNKMNNYNTNNNQQNLQQFQFHPQITNFSINQVDEEEIPEEKMHSPRTPYGSVPDPINNNQGRGAPRQYLYPPHNINTPNMEPMQRTISASSMESIRSYSAQSTVIEQESNLINYTPTLSATSSINRSGIYSTSTTPDQSPVASPCGTPKQYQLKITNQSSFNSVHQMQMQQRGERGERKRMEEEEEKKYPTRNDRDTAFSFGDRRNDNNQTVQDDRNKSIEAIALALNQVKSKKQNGFAIYKQGLGTYSNGCNSGVNTNGSCTPISMSALSRESSCNSLIGMGSECSYGDDDKYHNDLDESDLQNGPEFNVESGASTPFEPDPSMVTALSPSKINTEFSEDEMETPVPTSTVTQDDDTSPFDFEPIFGRNGFGLAQISEDAEQETITTPNTNATELTAKDSIDSTEAIAIERESHFDIIDDDSSDEDEPIPSEHILMNSSSTGTIMKLVNDGEDEEDDELCMDLEDEIILKGSRFQSSTVLFLDVDGVLLSTKEQQTLGKGENIKFNDDVTSLMIKLCRETNCDIVISSTWQFYLDTHLKWLCRYLNACGWAQNKIHTLLDLLPKHADDGINYGREWYEQSPYCRCRARGIQKIVSMYSRYITRWCALDDLPLHSQKPVCIPNKDDISTMTDNISEAYFKPFTWRIPQKEQLMPDIKYCVKYALTSLPNCIFSTQSFRFGYEYNQTMIYYQADAIAKLIKLTYELKDNTTYQIIIQNMMAVMNQYLGNKLTYQGDPYIAPYLIQTDQATGITPQNIENCITLLTYQQAQTHSNNSSTTTTPIPLDLQMNDSNTITTTV